MPIAPEKEYELRKQEIDNQSKSLAQLADQSKTTAFIGLASAFLVFLASIGGQVVETLTNSSTAAGIIGLQDDYALYVNNSFIGSENAGLYLFQPDTGKVWIARAEPDGNVSWLKLPRPSETDLQSGKDPRTTESEGGVGAVSEVGEENR